MQRLVYAPRVQAWIKGDEGVVDVSDYITTCDVRRKVNQVSQADLTLRNPKMIFTEHKRADGSIGPMFHPMDPIIIAMTRLRGKPIQVFTGYCDKTPYLQLFPGVCRLETSCTMKRLQYTFWDPGLPFVIDFLQQYGWVPKGKGTIVSPEGASKSLEQTKLFNDGSIANLLFAVLKNIGGWDEKNIFIENLPDGILPIVTNLFEQGVPDNTKSTKELEDFLRNIIGTAALGNSPVAGTGTNPGGTTGGVGVGDWVRMGATVFTDTGATACTNSIHGICYAELGGDANTQGNLLAKVFEPGKKTLPCGYKLEIRVPSTNKTVIAQKLDNGYGQGDPHYKIDFWTDLSKALGVDPNTFKGDVLVRKVADKPSTSTDKGKSPAHP